MGESMHDHQSGSDRYYIDGRTLAMPLTTALKARRGWSCVELRVSNWLIAVFADPISFLVVSTGPGMGLTSDVFFPASSISLIMNWVGN